MWVSVCAVSTPLVLRLVAVLIANIYTELEPITNVIVDKSYDHRANLLLEILYRAEHYQPLIESLKRDHFEKKPTC